MSLQGVQAVTRKTIIGILALPVLVVLFLAMSWIDGAVVRARLARLDHAMRSSMPLFIVTNRKATGGLFNSTVEVSYQFNDKLFNSIAPASAKQTAFIVTSTANAVDSPPAITLRHHIQHGPIPGFATLGLARIDTEIVIPEDARQELRKSIGTDQPLKIITLLGYRGGTTTIDSPAFVYTDKNSANSIEWHGIKGRMHFTRGLNSQDGNITLLGLSARDNKGGDATLGPVHLDYDLKRAFKYLATGKVSLTIERLTAVMPQKAGAANMDMRDLAYEVDTSASGDYLDMVAKVGVGSMSIAALKSTAVHYDFSLRHLHGPTVSALMEKLRDTNAALADGESKDPQQILAPYKEYGPVFLEHQPEFAIDRISLAVPEGALQMSGKASIPGYAHGDLDSGPMVLLPKVEANLDIAVDEGLLNFFWSMQPAAPAAPAPPTKGPAPPSRAEAMKAQLAALEQQGFVTRSGSRLSSHIEFKHGALTVNGKPMGPPPGAGR
jgi:uncharacterized protein YdgA (DUF945 family)